MAQLRLCMNLKIANPWADLSLKAPPSIEVIYWEANHEDEISKLIQNLCVEASIREAKDKCSEDCEILI